jgi:hypothetical protein
LWNGLPPLDSKQESPSFEGISLSCHEKNFGKYPGKNQKPSGVAMTTEFPLLAAFAAGFAINALDISCTLLFAVKPWEAELRRQGLESRKMTPPYYILTNFVGGLILTFVYIQFAKTLGSGVTTGLISSLLIWFVSRIYGGGHVVMGQMPFKIFAMMSAGLGVGYVAGGQLLSFMLGG